MRILFFTWSLYQGGAETILRMLANGLAERGHTVTIATDASYSDLGKYSTYFDLNDKINVVSPIFPIPKKHRFYALALLEYWRKSYSNINKIIRDFKPDIAISFIIELNGKILLNTLGKSVPIIVSEHSAVNRRYPRRLEIKRRITYPHAAAVTVLTKSDLTYWNKHNNVVWMPNPAIISSDVTPSDRGKVVLAAGRIDAWDIKGFDTLISVWSRLEKSHPDWRLVIAGDGKASSFEHLQNLCNMSGCRNVDFPGQIKDLSGYMRQVSIFALTSRVEGFSIVLAEAMDAQCACISFDCDNGPREIIENDISGILVKNQDESEMADKLDELMSDPTLRQRLSNNARKSLHRYDINTVLDRWESLFDTIVNRRPLIPFRQ